jgi:hypothetical protein
MSDSNHPQDQQHPVSSQSGRVPLPRDKELEDELQRVKEELEAPRQDKPAVPSGLQSAAEVGLERERETVRRERLTLERGAEEIKEFGFRRKCLVAILGICGLIAAASTGVIAAGIATHTHSLLAPALVPLSSSGALSVGAWRIYVGKTPSKPKPEPTGEGP